MPIESPAYRDNLARLDQAFPHKEGLTQREVAQYLGRDVTTVCRRLGYLFRPGVGVTKATLARKLSETY